MMQDPGSLIESLASYVNLMQNWRIYDQYIEDWSFFQKSDIFFKGRVSFKKMTPSEKTCDMKFICPSRTNPPLSRVLLTKIYQSLPYKDESMFSCLIVNVWPLNHHSSNEPDEMRIL
jgi:hypothetical protein